MRGDALEKHIEKACCDFAFAKGWFECKVTSPSRRGFPDRFYARRGKVILVEYKRPDCDATEQQAKRHRDLRDAGVEVHVITNLPQAIEVFK